ncbi:expressed unknown protein [Seminavis robusta]|uniref:Uncharacterized protein n=1 Tax=Seminavis robusta TaxID=568900 RepID=A0A9N8EWF7_9STRA|nr:expressed unknown protein [Seminavis robusta]|eukprot:Sro2126_g315710.1 n/a (287) ;mRNA; f:9637-10586
MRSYKSNHLGQQSKLAKQLTKAAAAIRIPDDDESERSLKMTSIPEDVDDRDDQQLQDQESSDKLMERLNAPVVRNDDAVTTMRMQMIRELTRRLEAKKQNMNEAQRKKIPSVAIKLEAHLFSKANGCLHTYRDPATLQQRFKGILTALLRRKLEQAHAEAAMTMDTPSNRLEALTEAGVDPAVVGQVYFLVQQIAHLQEGVPMDQTPAPKGTKFQCLLDIEGGQVIPKEVKGIFVNVPIVNAYMYTPMHRLGEHNWPRLVKHTEKAIRDYHNFIAEKKAKLQSKGG